MVLVKKLQFLQLFLLANIGQENVFYDILQPKIAFLSKGRKLVIFPKVFVIFPFFPWFWSKNRLSRL